MTIENPHCWRTIGVAGMLMGLIVLSAMGGLARGEGGKVRATASADRIGLENTVTLDITIEGSDAAGAEIVEKPSAPDFRLIGGPNVSTQFRFVNGRASFTKVIAFSFMPLKTGRLELPPVKIRLDGQVSRTEPIPVEVVAGSVSPSSPSGRSPFGTLDPFDTDAEAGTPADPGDDLLLRLESPGRAVYVGQPIPLDLVLYYRVRIGGADLEKEGKFEGFWVETVELDPRDTSRVGRREHNGRAYNTQVLRRWVLFPLRSGRFDVDPWILRVLVETPTQSFFGMTRRQVVLRRTNSITINVMDFPVVGRPAAFNGLCGRFDIRAGLDKSAVATGEAATVRLIVQGEGNLRSIPEQKLMEIPGCKIYAPKVQDNIRLEGGTLRGSRTWEFVVIPLEAGMFELSIPELSYFDPGSQTFRSVNSPAMKLNATGDRVTGTGAGNIGGFNMPIEMKGRDIRHIHTGSMLEQKPPERLYRRPWFLAIFGLLVLVTLGAVAIDERRRYLQRDQRSWTRSRAAVQARRDLRACAALGRKGFSAELFDGVYRLLQNYLQARFGINNLELTGVRLRQVLSSHQISETATADLLDILQQCERYRYAPTVAETVLPQELLARLERLLRVMEGGRP
ncbi:MAG TPA: BatD family protein [Acidobacteriota bacterium]|nr:BatD family protein [Acidobacteriota bacterium]